MAKFRNFICEHHSKEMAAEKQITVYARQLKTNLYDWLDEHDDVAITIIAAGLLSLIFSFSILSEIIPIGVYTISFLILVVFILGEILYGFNDKKKNPNLGLVIQLKIDRFFSASVLISIIINIIWLFKHYKIDFNIILKWMGYIGVGSVAIVSIIAIAYGSYRLIILPWLEWNRRRIRK